MDGRCARQIRSTLLDRLNPVAVTYSTLTNSGPHFSHPVKNAHRVPTFVGVSREGFRPSNLLPQQFATVEHFTKFITCEMFKSTFPVFTGGPGAAMPSEFYQSQKGGCGFGDRCSLRSFAVLRDVPSSF